MLSFGWSLKMDNNWMLCRPVNLIAISSKVTVDMTHATPRVFPGSLSMHFRVLHLNRHWNWILLNLPMNERANVKPEESFYELPRSRICFGDQDTWGYAYFQWPQECLAPCNSLGLVQVSRVWLPPGSSWSGRLWRGDINKDSIFSCQGDPIVSTSFPGTHT